MAIQPIYILQYNESGKWHNIFLSEIDRYFTNDVNLIETVKQNYSQQWPLQRVRTLKYIPAINANLQVNDPVCWTSIFNGKQTYCQGIIKDVYPAIGIDDYTAYKVIGKSIVTGITIEDLIHKTDYSLQKIEGL